VRLERVSCDKILQICQIKREKSVVQLSQRALGVEPSITLASSAKAKLLREQGRDVAVLTVGESDFPTPVNVQDAAIYAIRNGLSDYYTASSGIPALRKAVAEYTERTFGIGGYTAENVCVTDGAKFALYAAFQAILNPGDEVLIPVPYWVSYGEQVKMAGGVPVFITPGADEHLKVSVKDLEAGRTEKTRVIILNSPNNPTGMVYTREELEAIGNWACDHEIFIISDDIYGQLVYNGAEFTPIAAISDRIRENTLIVNGVSKTYAMTGWRIGFAIANDKALIKAIGDIASQSTSNSAAVSQYAALEALNGPQDHVETTRQIFEARLNEAYPLVAALPGVKLEKPQGAFYLFPNIRETMTMTGFDNVTDWCDALLEEENVALVTGEGFGDPDSVRISYAADIETVKTAVERMAHFIDNHKQ
jgi:aspartate/methionine/tyrosine aminotransferase